MHFFQKKVLKLNTKSVIVLLFFLLTITISSNAQIKLLDEVTVSDSILFFDGDRIDIKNIPPNSDDGYDYAYGNALTPHGDCVKSYRNFVFMTWYRGGKYDRHVMLTRYNLETGVKKTIEFPHQHTGYNGKWWIGETHNTIAVGICPKDSSIHLLYDMHRNGNVPAFANDYLRYSFSEDGGATVPDEEFTIERFVNSAAGNYKHLSFNGISNITVTKLLTYPAFFTNDEGDLFMKNRFGYSENGRFLFARYDGEKWHGYTDFNRSNASNYGSEYNWGLYGDLKYVNGKIRIGFQRRSNNGTDKYLYQNGVYYAYSDDPSGLTQWKDFSGTGFNRPLADADKIKIAEPGDWVQTTQRDKVYIVSGFDWTVTDNEDVHFVSKVKDNQYNVTKKLHTYKKANDNEFTTVEYDAGSEIYAAGTDVYVIGLKGGRVNIVKTKGGTSNFQEVYQHSSGPSFDKGVAHVADGKLFYYLKKSGGSGDRRTAYLQVFDLDITPADTTRILGFKNLDNGQEIEKGTNLTVEANVGSAYNEVSLWLGDTNLGTLTSAPYIWSGHEVLTNMEAPEYTFKLVAKDSVDAEEEAMVTLSVVSGGVPVVDVDSMIEKLIFYCPLEENGTDLSGNNNNATPGNAVAFEAGKMGNAASFSHTEGSYLTSADSVYKYSYPTAYTIAFWLKVDDFSERGDILQPAGGRTLLYSDGELNFRTFHQKNLAVFSITEEEKNEWFHVAMVIDQREGQTQHKFYVNGEQRGDTPSGYDLETDKPQSIGRLIFGSSSDDALQRNFTGMLDEIYMFDEVLSDDEIVYLMNTNNLMDSGTPPEPDPLASINVNFEDENKAENWLLEANYAESDIVDYDGSRTGSKAFKVTSFERNTGFHFTNNTDNHIEAQPGEYVHSIVYATCTEDGGMIAPSFSSEWASVTPGFSSLDNLEMKRFTFSRQYPDTEADNMNVYPRIRMKPGVVSNEIYVDDMVLYAHTSDVTDIVAPSPASNFAFVEQTTEANEFSWTEGVDSLTGVQKTYILRTTTPLDGNEHQAPEAPELLSQVEYSVNGGSEGPNTVGNWAIIDVVDAGTNSYIDESIALGVVYTYAIVHRDLAFNNSEALINPIDNGTSVGSIKIENLKVFPVPVKHTLNISGTDATRGYIYNMTGQKKMDLNNIKKEIDVSSLTGGLYILQLINSSGDVEIIKFPKK